LWNNGFWGENGRFTWEEETVQDGIGSFGIFFSFEKYGSFGSCPKHTKQANTTFFGKRKLPPAPCIAQMDKKLRESLLAYHGRKFLERSSQCLGDL